MAQTTSRKMKARVGREVSCQYCGETVNSLRLGSHVRWDCKATPQRLDEDVDKLPPGSIIGIGSGAPQKKRWSREDFYRAYGTPDTWPLYTPPRSQRVQVLGRVFYFQDGVDGRFPTIAIDVLKQSIENDRNTMFTAGRRDLSEDVTIVGRGGLGET